MSFWNTSDGSNVANETATSFEVAGGNIEPLPDGAHVLAVIEDAKWRKTQNDEAEYLEIKWAVLKPTEFQNRKVFHKVWASDLDPGSPSREKAIAKRDKAVRMFAVIDANAGGKLAQKNNKPTDVDLQSALVGRTMVVGLRVWETKNRETGEDMKGNWVYFVGDKNSELRPGKQAASTVNAGSGLKLSPGMDDMDGDSIPF